MKLEDLGRLGPEIRLDSITIRLERAACIGNGLLEHAQFTRNILFRNAVMRNTLTELLEDKCPGDDDAGGNGDSLDALHDAGGP